MHDSTSLAGASSAPPNGLGLPINYLSLSFASFFNTTTSLQELPSGRILSLVIKRVYGLCCLAHLAQLSSVSEDLDTQVSPLSFHNTWLEVHDMSEPDTPDAHEHQSLEKVKDPAQHSLINEKTLLRKIDLKVLPILFLVYVAAFLDRWAHNYLFIGWTIAEFANSVNISNALTLQLPKDLHLKHNQPNIALTIFFVPYVLFEIPSNIALKYFKPHIWSMPASRFAKDSGLI